MSGEDRRSSAPQGPPWSLDLLADLHAGVLDEAEADELRRQVAADPEAREVLAALDATGNDLADLPPLTIPDDVAARIEAALEEEVRAWSQSTASAGVSSLPTADRPASQQHTGQAQVVDFAEARRRRRRRFGLGAGLLAAAAAVTGVVVLTTGTMGTRTNEEAAGPPPAPSAPPPLALQGDQVTLSGAQFSEALGAKQYGALSDPQKLIGCLQANGVKSGKPMGAREITLNGRPAELLILPAGKIGEFRLLTVGPECGPGTPATISDSMFGG
jgi:hypothetical protein